MFKFHSLVAAFALAALMPLVTSAAQHQEDAKMMKKCALVCSTCQIECDSCFAHCLQLVADGKTEHKATAQTLWTVLNVAKHVQRSAVATVHLRNTCSRVVQSAARIFATACEKFPKDEQMMACAKSCRDCAKTCLDMSKHDHK